MDYSLFDDAKCISMIYKEKMPDLQNVEIVKMEITPGEDAEIRINPKRSLEKISSKM